MEEMNCFNIYPPPAVYITIDYCYGDGSRRDLSLPTILSLRWLLCDVGRGRRTSQSPPKTVAYS